MVLQVQCMHVCRSRLYFSNCISLATMNFLLWKKMLSRFGISLDFIPSKSDLQLALAVTDMKLTNSSSFGLRLLYHGIITELPKIAISPPKPTVCSPPNQWQVCHLWPATFNSFQHNCWWKMVQLLRLGQSTLYICGIGVEWNWMRNLLATSLNVWFLIQILLKDLWALLWKLWDC